MEGHLWSMGGQRGEQKASGPAYPHRALAKSSFLRSDVNREEGGRALACAFGRRNSSFIPRAGPSFPYRSHTSMSSRAPTVCMCAQTWGVQDTPGLEEEAEVGEEESALPGSQ